MRPNRTSALIALSSRAKNHSLPCRRHTAGSPMVVPVLLLLPKEVAIAALAFETVHFGHWTLGIDHFPVLPGEVLALARLE
jgi:hypothetical protein